MSFGFSWQRGQKPPQRTLPEGFERVPGLADADNSPPRYRKVPQWLIDSGKYVLGPDGNYWQILTPMDQKPWRKILGDPEHAALAEDLRMKEDEFGLLFAPKPKRDNRPLHGKDYQDFNRALTNWNVTFSRFVREVQDPADELNVFQEQIDALAAASAKYGFGHPRYVELTNATEIQVMFPDGYLRALKQAASRWGDPSQVYRHPADYVWLNLPGLVFADMANQYLQLGGSIADIDLPPLVSLPAFGREIENVSGGEPNRDHDNDQQAEPLDDMVGGGGA